MTESRNAVILAGVRRAVSRILDANAIDRSFSDTDALNEVGLASIDMVNLMLAVEAEFDLTIPQDEITAGNFTSVATIGSLVGRLGTAGLPRQLA